MLFNRTARTICLLGGRASRPLWPPPARTSNILPVIRTRRMLMKASMIFAVYSPQTQPAAGAAIPTLEVETFMAS
jgi:hypothetical protein